MWAPHSIENTRFTNGSEAYETEAKRWRRQIGIADDDCVVLFAGKLEPKKAPDLLVRAFMARLANKPNVHLVFAGSGILESKLRVSIGETPNVHFLGFQNQSRMPVVYRLGDVFVLPSRGPGETWGLAVNEAMACCRAVVVSDRAGCATDLVRTGETGFAFPSERDGVLAGIIDTLVSDPALRSRIAQNGRRLIGEWSVETQAARIEKAVITCGGASVTC
jgi:glycosyltransferase involved in cell wall biosynthesis